MAYTEADKATFETPPCPHCGAASAVDWIDVSWQFAKEKAFMPGQFECTARCFEQMSWPERIKLHEIGSAWKG